MRPVLTDGTEDRWSVFVGGSEVVDYLSDFDHALEIADDYVEDDYSDVVLYQYDTGEEVRI